MSTNTLSFHMILVSVFSIILFLFLINLFIPNIINKEYLYFIPISIFTIIIVICFLILINNILKLNKELVIQNDKIIIKQKGKIIVEISKLDIKEINVIQDLYTKEIELIYFKYNKKYYYIEINDNNIETINEFIKDLNIKKRSNLLYYIIELICNT